MSDKDARSRRIRLTDEGLAIVDGLMERHVANEHRLVAGLSERDRIQLADLLRRWGRSLDADAESGSSPRGRRRSADHVDRDRLAGPC